ncbi:hypothetical protein [Marinitoga lauensis]|uniref:hypothetical protein n=1 Tax=Marinitoga lauensis TaxID=2201189 RepID=UPI001012F1E4|nr:hypothetical protein [Marinitoga lauensis]
MYSNSNEGKYNKLETKINSLEKSIEKLNSINNKYFIDLKNEFKELNDKLLNLSQTFNNSQNEYYKKIELIINKRDILNMIKNLDGYIDNSQEFKLIEMVDSYKTILSKYNSLKNDKEIEEEFKKITEKVYNKFLNIVNNEMDYLKNTMYSLNVKKDIRYLSYVFSIMPRVDLDKHKTLETKLNELKNIEKIKVEEYNNKAMNSINEYLELFSRKVVLQNEIINKFKNNILTINPELLLGNVKEMYFEVIKQTKEILKEKYVW